MRTAFSCLSLCGFLWGTIDTIDIIDIIDAIDEITFSDD